MDVFLVDIFFQRFTHALLIQQLQLLITIHQIFRNQIFNVDICQIFRLHGNVQPGSATFLFGCTTSLPSLGAFGLTALVEEQNVGGVGHLTNKLSTKPLVIQRRKAGMLHLETHQDSIWILDLVLPLTFVGVKFIFERPGTLRFFLGILSEMLSFVSSFLDQSIHLSRQQIRNPLLNLGILHIQHTPRLPRLLTQTHLPHRKAPYTTQRYGF
mmetsp:Transcript_41464/g.74743  ORF Transcript_41464/g.74743 Transcript_41464/m.74743 type:complete len:212 (-) Transcript_41464:1229-1864(-)